MSKAWALLRPSTYMIDSAFSMDEIKAALKSILSANSKSGMTLINPFRKDPSLNGSLTDAGFILSTTTQSYTSTGNVIGTLEAQQHGTRITLTFSPITTLNVLLPLWLFISLAAFLSIFLVHGASLNGPLSMIFAILFIFGVLQPLVFYQTDKKRILRELSRLAAAPYEQV
jgi:hypothetical protein